MRTEGTDRNEEERHVLGISFAAAFGGADYRLQITDCKLPIGFLVLADSILILANFAKFFAGFAVGNYLLQIGRIQIADYRLEDYKLQIGNCGPKALTETKKSVMYWGLKIC